MENVFSVFPEKANEANMMFIPRRSGEEDERRVVAAKSGAGAEAVEAASSNGPGERDSRGRRAAQARSQEVLCRSRQAGRNGPMTTMVRALNRAS